MIDCSYRRYWYGSSKDPANAYSFFAPKQLTPYETAAKKGWDKLPITLQKKLDEEKPVPPSHSQLVEGLEEMREDLEKDPKDRTGWTGSDFIEAYAITTDEEDSVPNDQPPIATKKNSKAKNKSIRKKKETNKTSGKKRKVKEQEEEEADYVMKQDELSRAPKQSKKGKKSKRAKEKPEQASELASFFSLEKGVKSELSDIKHEPAVKAEDRPADWVSEVPAVDNHEMTGPGIVEPAKLDLEEEYKFAMGDSGSDDDKYDEDFDDGDFGGAVDKADEDLGGDLVEVAAPPKPKARRASKTKEAPKKKATKSKPKIEKNFQKVKKVPTEKARRKMEQKKFEESERELKPVLDKWQRALNDNDEAAIVKIFSKMLRLVERVHWALMPDVMKKYMKPSKNVITQKDDYKKLYEALKSHYASSQEDAIPGFRPESTIVKDEMSAQTEKKSSSKLEDVPTKEVADTKNVPIPVKEDTQKAIMAPPIKRITSLEKVEEKAESEPAPQKEVKVERKKFSLGKLMRPTSDATKGSGKGSSVGKSSVPTQSIQKQPTMPDWVTGALQVETPSDDTRVLGLEFLRQAAPFIPSSKGVDHDGIALALEASIYKFMKANHQFNWAKKYWEKIDGIVVALSGEKDLGTISSMIAQGKFETADQVVGLADDAIMNSFLGRPVMPP